MVRVLLVLTVIMQALDVATTYIGSLVVAGFYEANPLVAWIAGQPPVLWKLIVLKVAVLAFVVWIVRLGNDSWPIKVALGLAVVVYVAIVWNNIMVIL